MVDFRERSQSAQTRPVAVAQAQATTPARDYPAQSTNYNNAPKRSRRWIGIALASLLALGALGYGVWEAIGSGTPDGVDSSKYQAVFLTNDQVYFGKIKDIGDDTLVLGDIYYLQSNSKAPATGQEASNPQGNAELSLAKLGDELHGPEDSMRINMDQVLFWENLKPEGKVSTAIKDFRK